MLILSYQGIPTKVPRLTDLSYTQTWGSVSEPGDQLRQSNDVVLTSGWSSYFEIVEELKFFLLHVALRCCSPLGRSDLSKRDLWLLVHPTLLLLAFNPGSFISPLLKYPRSIQGHEIPLSVMIWKGIDLLQSKKWLKIQRTRGEEMPPLNTYVEVDHQHTQWQL